MAGLHSNYTTERDTFQRLEVITGVARRRRWPRSEKARIVAESYALGASAAAEFVPVVVAAQSGLGSVIGEESGRIEVIAGGIKIRLGSGFDAGDLRRVLQIVRELA